MSFLTMPTLAFSGQFQADTSTVNNDPRHYSNEHFEERFQELQDSKSLNGWWNPGGTGIFRLNDCKVTACATGAQGGFTNTGFGDDEVLTFTVENSTDRPSGKIVDLDPEWQLASKIYGQVVTLRNPKTGDVILQGEFEPAPFRDLWFTRGPADQGGDNRASAMFQSVLTNLVWNLDGIESPILKLLKKMTQDNKLSIRMTTYCYHGGSSEPMYTYGKLVGAIGPYLENEPKSFVLGRRFMPLNGASSTPLSLSGEKKRAYWTCFSAYVNDECTYINMDLSNALPVGDNENILDIGDVDLVVLKNTELHENSTITKADFELIGAVPQTEFHQVNHGGIVTLAIPEAAQALISGNPLALVFKSAVQGDNVGTVLMREETKGIQIRPETFTFRLDPNEASENTATTTFYVSKYGKPQPDAEFTVFMPTPVVDEDNCPTDPTPATSPKANYPIYNSPANAITFNQKSWKTDANGMAEVTLTGDPNLGTPREYLDGQVYIYNYNMVDTDQTTICQQFDVLAILEFSKFEIPNKIQWSDVQPIMQQYANLYPVMSKGLFDFSQEEIFKEHAAALHFVFNKPVEDPDYMPVTRDLSSAKRTMLLTYLNTIITENKGQAFDSLKKFASRCPMHQGSRPDTSQSTPEDYINSVASSKQRSV
ncbi:hypothetical protein [Terasakiella sp. SH-1]|uniref:hypothetical protein n=1 Tax=Terasakiella sp. SH-1 TaxID=2560057 RepID=UPI001073DDB5|nr:hypothetical protein [Terasakiella sp. SH-1]